MSRTESPLGRHLGTFIDRGVEQIDDDDDLVQCMRRLNAIVLIGTVAVLVYLALSLLQGYWTVAILQAGLVLVFVAGRAIAVAKPEKRVVPAVHAALAALTIVLAYSAWFFGPAVTSAFLLALVILVAAYTLGVRAAIIWTAICIGALAVATFAGEPIELRNGATETTFTLFWSRAVFLLAILGMAVAARVLADRRAGDIEASYHAEAAAHAQTRIAKDEAELAKARALEIGERLELAREHAVTAETEAEQANAAKSEFLSRVSHELRTPLNAILGFSQLLNKTGELPERESDWADRIHDAGGRLLTLIEELLDISRIEAGSLDLQLESVNLADVIAGVVDLVQPLTVTNKVTIITDLEDTALAARADEKRLSQVLINLVSNAIKYNSERGTVTVSTESTTDRVRIKVADTGLGIPQEKLEDLFVPFDRLGAERGDVEGTGIGLAIAKRLIEAMGGTMGADSKYRQGSTFWVELGGARRELPAREQVTPALSRLDAGDGTATYQAVYIEDEPTNAELVSEVLASRGDIDLRLFNRGSVAVDHIRRHPPDVLLLDAHLPDMSAAEIIDELRGAAPTALVPVIIVSADATTTTKNALLRLGVTSYITKPIDIDRLLAILDDTLLSTASLGARPSSAPDG